MSRLTDLAAQLGRVLELQAAQVSTAESCTGGGIAEAITRIAGSSAWFEVGFVTYSNRQKTRQLQVPASLFGTVGAVSGEVVEAMARGAQQASGARYAVAVSGVAGPGGGSPDKPVGTVWLAWAGDAQCATRRFQFQGDRLAIREQSVEAALVGLIRLASGENPLEG